MTEERTNGPIDIVLSREELLLVLDLMEADYLPGLDADPLGELNPDGRELALTVAARGLRARGLAQVNDDGELNLHATLLAAVGACAYASNTIFVYHWPAAGEVPTRYFGHVRDGDIAAHTRPEDVLHLFTVLPSKEQLIEQVLTACAYEEASSSDPFEFPVNGDEFVQVRELALGGKAQNATELLVSAGTASEAASAFVSTLTNAPRISVLQTLTQEEGESVLKRDFTVIQNSEYTWFIAPTSEDSENPALVVRSSGKDEIEALLNDSL